MELIRQEFQNVSTKKLVLSPVFFTNRLWQLKVKDLPDIKLDVALPTTETFFHDPTDHFFPLTGGRKLYFQHPALPTSQEEAMIPLFYNVIGEESFTPRPSQQKFLNSVKPMVDRNAELVAEYTSLKRKYEVLTEKNERLHDTIHQLHEGEITRLKEKVVCLEEKVVCLEEQVKKARIS